VKVLRSERFAYRTRLLFTGGLSLEQQMHKPMTDLLPTSVCFRSAAVERMKVMVWSMCVTM